MPREYGIESRRQDYDAIPASAWRACGRPRSAYGRRCRILIARNVALVRSDRHPGRDRGARSLLGFVSIEADGCCPVAGWLFERFDPHVFSADGSARYQPPDLIHAADRMGVSRSWSSKTACRGSAGRCRMTAIRVHRRGHSRRVTICASPKEGQLVIDRRRSDMPLPSPAGGRDQASGRGPRPVRKSHGRPLPRSRRQRGCADTRTRAHFASVNRCCGSPCAPC